MTSTLNYNKSVFYFVAAHIILFAIGSFAVSGPLIPVIVMQSVLSLAAFTGWKYGDINPAAKDLSAIALALTPAVLVFLLFGHEWQIDAHMYFFAALAMTTGFRSVRAIIFAAGAIALHHIILNFAFPYTLFQDGADFSRVLFHAVIVILETAVLIYVVLNMNKLFDSALKDKSLAEQCVNDAETARKELLESEKLAEKKRLEGASLIADNFETSIGGIIGSFESESNTLNSLSRDIAGHLEATLENSQSALSYSQDAANNVQTVASAAEELSVSIREISQNLQDTMRTTNTCSASAADSKETLTQLEAAVDEIDSVIQAINDVAEQTNLLALNATIEAARAGEAGKGFAVVANEVKSLANQTHKMTDEIVSRVETIKNSAKSTVTSVENIITQIGDVDAKTSSVAAAVEEQSSATDEISRSIAKASDSSTQVASLINKVSELVQKSDESKNTLIQTSDIINGKSLELKETSNQLITNIRKTN